LHPPYEIAYHPRAMGESRADIDATATPPTGRFSLERLSSAFARLMGAPSLAAAKAARPQIAIEKDDELLDASGDGAAVTPRMIIEAMLFVGAADGRPLSSAEMAGQIRDVEPAEVDALTAELNAAYRAEGAAYEIVSGDGGHRLQLRKEHAPQREKFRGQARTARLTPAALEVLSVVAYRQGVTGEEINKLRGTQSYAILAQLVRRQLVRVERKPGLPRGARYHTTERFNRLFGVTSPRELPRSEDLEDS
jgi:segregation and condensation protein B